MRKLLVGLGVLALVAWTAGGLACWILTREHVTVVLEQGERKRALPEDPQAPVLARLDELAQRLEGLAQVLEKNLTLLDERAAVRSREVQSALESELAALRSELDLLRAAPALASRAPEEPPLASEPEAEAASPVLTAEVQKPLAATEAPAEQAPAAPAEPAGHSSFLAFRLPKDDFRFDEKRSWTIQPDQSRVGFDAQSTLHDFSGTSTAVSGSITFEPAHPDLEPRGDIRVEAASLDSDNDARDEEMREHLDVEHHAEILFHLTSFEPGAIDPALGRVSGTAHGTLTLRGAERPFAMPVSATIDAARRLLLEGEAPLSLPDFGVPVPSKLGLISMKEQVVIWIALRARLDGRESS